MNVIYGKESADLVKDRYTLLELDQISYTKHNQLVDVYCPLDGMSLISSDSTMKDIDKHREVIECYRKREWSRAKELVESLQGKWNGELDSFYEHLLNRIDSLLSDPPGEDWSHVLVNDN